MDTFYYCVIKGSCQCRLLSLAVLLNVTCIHFRYLHEMCTPVSNVPNLSALRSASRLRLRNDLYCVGWGVKLYSLTPLLVAIWSYPEQDYNSATVHFVWLVRSPGTVYQWTFVRHLHYQRSKACSRHICSLVPTSLTNCCQSTSSEHCTAPF